MKFGIDRLLEDASLRAALEGKRVALIAHPASVTEDLAHSLDARSLPDRARSAVFSAIYARRIAVEARQMSAALNATEMVLAREQKLSALDGLAAAAAYVIVKAVLAVTLVIGTAAGILDAGAALPALFAVLLATIVASGVQYVWVWGRRAVAQGAASR